MNGFKYNLHTNELSYHIHLECGGICNECDRRSFEYQIRSKDYVLYKCDICAFKRYGHFLKDRDVVTHNYNHAIFLLSYHPKYEIPDSILKEIFIYNNGRTSDVYVENVAFYMFNPKICESARLAIHTFCLFCIKYHKAKLNKDIRRKISQMIWDNKIEFLK